MSEWLEYQKALEEEQRQEDEGQQRAEQMARWTAPKGECIKISTDAALKQKQNRAGWGIIARDKDGKLVGS